jgi:hypothetical protein
MMAATPFNLLVNASSCMMLQGRATDDEDSLVFASRAAIRCMGLSEDKRQVGEHSGNFKEYLGKTELIVK